MSEQIDENERVRPWQWPGEWFKDEKFWREVTARAMSGIIVLILAAFGAVAAGLIVQPYFVIRMCFTLLAVLSYFIFTSRLIQAKVFQRVASQPRTPRRNVLNGFAALIWFVGLGLFIWVANVAELF